MIPGNMFSINMNAHDMICYQAKLMGGKEEQEERECVSQSETMGKEQAQTAPRKTFYQPIEERARENMDNYYSKLENNC